MPVLAPLYVLGSSPRSAKGVYRNLTLSKRHAGSTLYYTPDDVEEGLRSNRIAGILCMYSNSATLQAPNCLLGVGERLREIFGATASKCPPGDAFDHQFRRTSPLPRKPPPATHMPELH